VAVHIASQSYFLAKLQPDIRTLADVSTSNYWVSSSRIQKEWSECKRDLDYAIKQKIETENANQGLNNFAMKIKSDFRYIMPDMLDIKLSLNDMLRQ